MTPVQIVAVCVCSLIVGFAMGLIASAYYDERKQKGGQKNEDGTLSNPRH